MKKMYLLAALTLACTAVQAQTSFGNVTYPAPNSAGTGGGSGNSYFGHNAGDNNTAAQNTFLGAYSGFTNTTGDFNAFVGSNSGYNNLSGTNNSFLGYQSGYYNNSGGSNTFIGSQSGFNNTTGYENSGLGYLTLFNNTDGVRNTANGIYALYGNTSGIENTGIGYSTLGFNTSGSGNIAAGTRALLQNTAGNYNSAIGYEALQNNFNSNYNIAVGYRSGRTNTNGSQNTFLGSESGLNNQGSGNIFLGYQAGYNEAGSNLLYIANSNTVTPLIWGDFTASLLRINGSLSFTGPLLPNDAPGQNGQVLTSGGAGAVPTWTSLPSSVNSLNGLTGAIQTFATGSTGTDFSISSSGTTHTVNLPSASAANRGLLTAADWTTFNNKANINSPTFTGTPLAPTAGPGTNTTQIATTAFVTTADNLKANINSPTFTGTPLAPTAGPGTNNTQLATTAFVTAAVSVSNTFPSFPASAGDGGGSTNSYFGHQAGISVTGQSNTFIGYTSGYNTTNAFQNTSVGRESLYSNTTGNYNTSTGHGSLNGNTTGSYNTAVGMYALSWNTTGSFNTALGHEAGTDFLAGLTNTTALGYNARTTASNQVRIGSAGVMSIGGYVNWSNVSDARFKKNVEQNVPGLDFIAKLKPVTYTMDVTQLNSFLRVGEPWKNKEISEVEQQAIREKEAIRYTGFIAQEVEQAAQEIGYDFSGIDKPQNEHDHYGLRYAEFVVPLVKAVQELSAKDKAQQEMMVTQQQRIETLEQELETLKSAVYGASVKTSGTSAKTTGEALTQTLPEGFALYQNTPNPFDKTTVIGAQLPESVRHAKIVVYNLQGLELASYPLPERGKVSVEISGGRFPSGMYLYALLADGQVIDTKKMILTN